MDIAGMAAYSVGMMQGMQKQQANVAMTRNAIESNTQAAQTITAQVAEQAKAVAQAATSGKIDITV
ncbi:MAG: hypothetical protein HWE30_17485 [Methylocystaceae bacterium]|nr:hypothetical protein [Methylocystaceae bacterium]